MDDYSLESLGAALRRSVHSPGSVPSLGRRSLSPRGSVGSLGPDSRRRQASVRRASSGSPSAYSGSKLHVTSVFSQEQAQTPKHSLHGSICQDPPDLLDSMARGTSSASGSCPSASSRHRGTKDSLEPHSSRASSLIRAHSVGLNTTGNPSDDHFFPNLERSLSLCHRLPFERWQRKAAPICRAAHKNRLVQAATFGALLSALFLPDLWVLLDRPGNGDLDVVLAFLLLLFLVELVVQSLGFLQSYWGSFFFWMDLLGAASLLLDLSFLSPHFSPSAGSSGSNVVILRAARVAKLGARAGRFTRLAKLLRFLPFMRDMQGADRGTAKVISARLISSLSMRVSCLIIIMVMVMPVFSLWTYPGEDWSPKSWVDVLDAAAVQYPDSFQEQLASFQAFYGEMYYYPYRLSAKPGAVLPAGVADLLPWQATRSSPRRAANSLRQEGHRLVCDFNFQGPNQFDALMNIFLLMVVMVLMVGWSLMLSNFVSAQVLRPLEKLLLQVRRMASRIFQSVNDMTVTMLEEETGGDKDEDISVMLGNETELLDKVVAKLAVLSQIAMSKNAVDPEVLEDLGAADRAVIRGFQGQNTASHVDLEEEEEEEFDAEELRAAQKLMLESAGLSLELLDSNNLNPLELDRARNQAAATYFVGQLHHGVHFEAMVMQHFLEAVEAGYEKSSPYHNWYHAVDVAHFIYRLLRQCSTEYWLSGTERYGLLVSALCHDMGHPGVNNSFLVEVAHELALRYNDKSPLENMHCARLFELVSTAKCNIFAQMSKHQFQEIRKVCIEVILHTDNAQHFAMVKEVQVFYEVRSASFDALRKTAEQGSGLSFTGDALEQLSLPESRRLLLKLFLHLADISNCMKPFRVCRLWAMQIMEEFFMQGDVEKSRGMAVQALNDREKVNRAFSQVGFIEFLVAPLLLVAMKVMLPLETYGEQMLSNVQKWQQIWLSETKPAPTEAEKKAVSERIHKLNNRFLVREQ